MVKLTVKELLELKGVRQITFVQVARAEEAIAASLAGMDMIGTGFGFNPLRFRSRWRLSRACVASPGKS